MKVRLGGVIENLNNFLFNGGVRNILFSILFLAILSIPIVEDITSNSKISTQSFVGKDALITAVNDFKFQVLKDEVFNGLITAKDDWLLFTAEFSLKDYENSVPFTNEELEIINSRFINLCDYVLIHNMKLILMFAPNKNTIYPEYVPKEIFKVNDYSRLDQVVSLLQEKENCSIIDLRPTLLKAKSSNQVYFSTDTHWNHIGGFYVYQELARVLQTDFPSVQVRTMNDFDLVPFDYAGDLTLNNFGHFSLKEHVTVLSPKFPLAYTSLNFGSSEGFLSGLNQTQISYSKNNSLPKAVLYHDSFFNLVNPFLMENFSEAYYFWSFGYDLNFLDYKHPDYLIIEITERFLAEGLMSLPPPK